MSPQNPVIPKIRAAFMHGTFRKPFPPEAKLIPGDGYISELEKHVCNVVVEHIEAQAALTKATKAEQGKAA